MSVQIFLQGKLLGIEEFLLAPAERNTDQVFLGRSHWTSLLADPGSSPKEPQNSHSHLNQSGLQQDR